MRRILETPRLLLRELEEGDLDFTAAMLGHPEVMRYWPRCYTREEARDWIRAQRERYARDGYGYWLALDFSTGNPVGQVGLLEVTLDGVSAPGLGYIVHRPFQRRGYAVEGSRGVIDHAFHRLGKTRLVTPIRPENGPSLGVAAKLGLRLAGRTVHAGFDHLVFVLDREDWREAPATPEEDA